MDQCNVKDHYMVFLKDSSVKHVYLSPRIPVALALAYGPYHFKLKDVDKIEKVG